MDQTSGTTAAEARAGHVPSAEAAALRQAGATRLLMAGFAGAHLAGITAIIVFGITGGRTAAVSAAVGLVVVLLYRAIGQWVTARAAGGAVSRQFAVAIGSVVVRMTVLLALVALWLSLPDDITGRFSATAIAIGVLAAELGWLAAMIITAWRTRIPVYDVAAGRSPQAGGPT